MHAHGHMRSVGITKKVMTIAFKMTMMMKVMVPHYVRMRSCVLCKHCIRTCCRQCCRDLENDDDDNDQKKMMMMMLMMIMMMMVMMMMMSMLS